MTEPGGMRAADLLARCLEAQGFDRMFCVPGESYLSFLDALEDSTIQTVVCRHEGGAGLMAAADAKLTGRPGLCAASRGPGATNISIAVHLAEQDGVPLVVLLGQVAKWERGRGAFQEVDYTQMFGGMAKFVREVNDPSQLPEVVARAVQAACSPTPGPAIIVLPEDMLEEFTSAPVVPAMPIPRAGVASADIDRAMAMLARAERPLIIAGHGVGSEEGRAALSRAAEAHGIPVALTFKNQHLFDNASPLYAGHLGFKLPPAVIEPLKKADLVIAVGTRLADTPTQGWSFPRAPVPEQPLIHVHADAGVIGQVIAAEMGLAADPVAFLQGLAERNAELPAGRADWAAGINANARAMRDKAPEARPDGLDFGHMIRALAAKAPKDAILTMDAGNFSGWVHSEWPWDGTTQALGAAGGAMGLGVPAAIAASLRFPGRKVLGFCGDGGVLMTGSELATAAAEGATPIIVISDNGYYGTIRLHQEKAFPGRIAGTRLKNPDFAAWGRAFGALGLTVTTPEEAAEAVDAALAHDGPVVIHAKSSVEAISPFATISGIRAAATRAAE
ncbi:acetolactate synthase-1/2/3 large subunit [Albimonas donghaensis]|uniref:Acetolactate synthase-1/2/3 large subunit n=1 Tax=Albimonas donghaensis TaxID=356660 RepID=A0A1H3CDY7_9RHOB|nr:thiamine pyrophosphate-dependent enzyme [Albimonas donghaensis]SDX51719.1 acetolactate synthase-1/2/3 large subunit [Albimonas donghaensis]